MKKNPKFFKQRTGLNLFSFFSEFSCETKYKGNPLFVVAVAGTNVDSFNGWYKEDFAPGTMVNWPLDNSRITQNDTEVKKGKVSEGFAIGFKKVWDATSSVIINNKQEIKTVAEYLESRLAQSGYENSQVIVAGHSLGGALSPMVALALKEKFSSFTVKTYPSAGPTPGDQTFATYMVNTLPPSPF